MEIEIVSKNENKLLNRVEYTANVSHLKEATPPRLETRDKLAAFVNSDKERTIIVKMDSEFGKSVSQVKFRVYDSQEQLKEIELEHLVKRNGFVKEESS